MMFNRTMHGTQRGVATILIVLLIALSLTAAVLLGVQYNRSLQEQSISLHAQTAAQSKAWETAEIVRQYFDELQKDAGFDTLFTNIENELAGNNVLALNGFDNTTTATLQNAWKDSDDTPRFSVLIESTAAAGTKAEAKARLEVVISYVGDVKNHGLPSAGHFLGNTDLSGGIKVHVDKGQLYNISVDGNVTIGAVSIHGNEDGFAGINSIISTKSIEFTTSSNTVFEKLHANCDVRLNSASAAKYIYARNNICLINSGVPGGHQNRKNDEIKANNSVYIDGKDWGQVEALAGFGGHSSCPNDAEKYCSNKGEIPTAPGIELKSGTTESLKTTSVGTIKGGEGIKSDDIEPVPPVEVAKATLDVSKLEKYANYVFEYDESTKPERILVTVRNVNDIYSGTDENGKKFELRTVGKGGKKNMLCPVGVTGDAECRGPIVDGSGSIEYQEINNKGNKFKSWVIKGGIAPGFIIFKGKLKLEKGTFINTIGATESIEMKGDKVYSLNWAGENGKRNGAEYAPNGVCTNTVTNSNFKPTELCKNGYNSEGIEDYGNFGLLSTLDINLGSGSNVFGAVKAGSMLTAESNSTAHGYVSGLGGDVQHTLKGFSIDLTNLPDGYKLVDSDMEQDDESTSTEAHAVILWSRYK